MTILYRNGYTGEIVSSVGHDALDTPLKRLPVRTRRSRLQNALAAKVPKSVLQFNKKLLSLEDLREGGVSLNFQDGTKALADLVVGADGKRSVGIPYYAAENLF